MPGTPRPWCRSSEWKPPRTATVAHDPVSSHGDGVAVGGASVRLYRCRSYRVTCQCSPLLPPSPTRTIAVPAPTLLQIVPTLAGGGLARATLDTAQAVIAAGGAAIVASPGVPGARPAAGCAPLISSCRAAIRCGRDLLCRGSSPPACARRASRSSSRVHRPPRGWLGRSPAGSRSSGSPRCTRRSWRAAWRNVSSSDARRGPTR